MEDQSELRDEKLMHEHTFEYDEAVTKFANGDTNYLSMVSCFPNANKDNVTFCCALVWF